VICLLGRWLFDPAGVTSEDTRQFMWAGLRVLRAEAKVSGLTEDQVDRLLVRAFDTFHDAAESIWTTLKVLQTLPRHDSWACGESRVSAVSFWGWFNDLVPTSRCCYTPVLSGPSAERHEGLIPARECEGDSVSGDLFVACEEDRPVPVKMQFNEPLTLLDPDADILASFEP
jgi:hypothetical protein